MRKLDDRSTAMVFVGYEDRAKVYRVYNLVTSHLHVTRDIIFEENRAWDWPSSSSEPEEE
jgi:hypothetical protein